MIQGLDVFMSKHDLESGTRWSDALARQLEGCNFGVLCLTPENLDKPWLLYEAGALTKQLAGKACGLLLGGMSPAQVTGPLAQFQNRQFTEPDIKQLVTDINQSLETPLEERQIDLIFGKWWPDLNRDYQAAITTPVEAHAAPKREQNEVLEEILVRMRTLERKMVEAPLSKSESRSQRKTRALLRKANDLSKESVVIEVVADEESGKLSEPISIDTMQKRISDKLDQVQAKQLQLHGPIAELGLYTVPVELGDFVTAKLKVWIVPISAEAS